MLAHRHLRTLTSSHLRRFIHAFKLSSLQMAPFIPRASSKAERAGEELLLELDALNQALQSRSHTRSKSLTSYAASPLRASELKPSRKRTLQPRPSFKVPFRSTSISCDRPRRLLSSSSTKQSKQHHQHTKKEATSHSHTAKEDDFPLHLEEVHEQCNHHKNGHQHPKSRSPPHKGKGGPQQKEKGQQHSEKKSSQCEQIHGQKSIWRWRPLRALSHIILGSRCHLNVLFSLQVSRIESLPVAMNGLSLTVLWIFKSHCLRTTPSKILNGIAEFGETLQHRSTIHSTHCRTNNISRYDAKWCTLSIRAPCLDKLELARNYVDLSSFLPQDDTDGNLWRDKCHDASYKLSGMAKGGTLIVTFCHNLVQEHSLKGSHGTQSTSKTTLSTKSPPVSYDVVPLVESKASSASCLLQRGAAVHLHHSMGHCTDTLQESFAEDVHIAADFSSHDYSDSFEFKPPLKDDHLVELSFSHTHFITTDKYSKKSMSTLYDEGLPPFSHTIHTYEEFVVKGEGNKGIHKQPEQSKSQKPCESSPSRSPASGGLSFEEPTCMRHPKTDFDDDLDSVAEEFLNMLGMGFDAGHHNSEADSESPRERLLKQFEDDSFFMEISQGYG